MKEPIDPNELNDIGLIAESGVIAETPEALKLALDNVRKISEKIALGIANEDPKIVALSAALLKTRKMRELNNRVSESINRLSAESEKLIDSPDAESLEVLRRRKEIADELNKLLGISASISEQNGNLLEFDRLVREHSEDEISQALGFLEKIEHLVKSLDPKTEAN